MSRSAAIASTAPRLPHRQPWLLRYIAASGYALGALAYLVAALSPDPNPSDHDDFYALAVLDLVLVALLLLVRRMPFAVLKFLAITFAIVQVSYTLAVSDPTGGTVLYYFWSSACLGMFCRPPEIAANIAVLVVSVTIAVWRTPSELGETPVITALSVIQVVVLVTLATAWITEQMDRLMQQLQETASTDHLTGLLNRRALATVMEAEVGNCRTAGRPLSVAVFDLDHFKLVNDRFGHAAGDAALQRFAAVLRASLGRRDVAARTGGEEFTVLMPGRDLAAALDFARSVGRTLQRRTAADQSPLTTSAGVVQLGPGHETVEDLLVGADRALYRAKDSGRNRVHAAPSVA